MKAKLITIAAVLLFLVVAIVMPGSLTTAHAQKSKQKVIELKANKPTTRGEDPNVKNDTETNDPNSQMAAPEQKGGAKTRGGGSCEVRFDNRTQWLLNSMWMAPTEERSARTAMVLRTQAQVQPKSMDALSLITAITCTGGQTNTAAIRANMSTSK